MQLAQLRTRCRDETRPLRNVTFQAGRPCPSLQPGQPPRARARHASSPNLSYEAYDYNTPKRRKPCTVRFLDALTVVPGLPRGAKCTEANQPVGPSLPPIAYREI